MTTWMIWAALALSGTGETMPEWQAAGEIPAAPESGVRDVNGVFMRESAAAKRISEQLRKLEADHGYRIYLVVEPVLIATTAPGLAAQLQQAWLPAGNGLVIVYESHSRTLGFGRDPGGNTEEPPLGGNLIPSHETTALVHAAADKTDTTLAPDAYIEALVAHLVKEFTGYFGRRAAPPPPERSLRFGLLALGALALLALGAIGVGALTRLQSVAGIRRFQFKKVDRPERLGAPCGGGNVSTRSFKPRPPA